MKRLIMLCMALIATCALVSTAVACECGEEPLTQGYWKTHSSNGPAPYDEAWSGFENTEFFSSGQTYFEVLTTPPAAGNAYYILAHQWIAAGLNSLNGAIMPDSVHDAYWDAKPLLSDYAGDKEIPADLRERAIEDATILEEFNSGEFYN